MSKKRILTGHHPSGSRHLGHLAGTLENWVRLQDLHECFFLVANLHSDNRLRASQVNILNMLADWLAAGMEVLFSGTVKVKFIAQQTLDEACARMGLLYTQSFSEKVLTNNISGIFCSSDRRNKMILYILFYPP